MMAGAVDVQNITATMIVAGMIFIVISYRVVASYNVRNIDDRPSCRLHTCLYIARLDLLYDLENNKSVAER